MRACRLRRADRPLPIPCHSSTPRRRGEGSGAVRPCGSSRGTASRRLRRSASEARQARAGRGSFRMPPLRGPRRGQAAGRLMLPLLMQGARAAVSGKCLSAVRRGESRPAARFRIWTCEYGLGSARPGARASAPRCRMPAAGARASCGIKSSASGSAAIAQLQLPWRRAWTFSAA